MAPALRICRVRRTLRAALVGGALAPGVGCSPPSADVVVAWVEGRDDSDGNRNLRIYDRGDKLSVTLVPDQAGSGVELLSIEVDNRGGGVAISGRSDTEFLDLGDGRQPVLSSLAAGGGKLAPSFRFTRNADAILRGFDRQSVPAIALMPTNSAQAGEVTVLQTPAGVAGGTWRLSQASNAPIVAWVERGGFPTRPAGRVEIIAYPSDIAGPVGRVQEPTTVAAGLLTGDGIPVGAFELRVSDGWCPDRACVAPEGGSLTAQGLGSCEVEWWSWLDADDPMNVEQTTVSLDDGCTDASDPHLFAQIEHDVVLLDDERRIFVADLSTGAVTAGPKIWNGPLPTAQTLGVRLADRGHAVVFVSSDARVVRADASGVRIISAEAAPCPTAVSAIASPSGRWVLATCNGDGTFVPADQGAVYRVSSMGLEVYSGITLAPLGIDDAGNGLLYSFDPDDGEPRGLFVLTADGLVARVDDLEPEPDRVRDGQLVARWFTVQILAP